MPKYNISMGDVQNCAIGPGAQVSVSYPISLSFRIDAGVYDIASSKAFAEGVTLDQIITDKLREWIEQDDVPDPTPVPELGRERPTYSLDEYVAIRAEGKRPIADKPAFNEFADWAPGIRRKMKNWDKIWDCFCNKQDARDEADTQAEALR